MRERDLNLRIKAVVEIPIAMAATLVACFVGLACSSSAPKSRAGDAGAAGGGQGGSSMSGGTGGGIGGTIGPGGAGASAGGNGGSSTAGGTGGQGGMTSSPSDQGGCQAMSVCISGETVDSQQGKRDLSGECPAERECYSLYSGCFTTLCVLPQGTHCDGLLACNPGDTPRTSDTECANPAVFCYLKLRCAQSITCETWRTTACSGTSSDAGFSEPRDPSADGSDAGRMPCCGDGITDADHGEECDLGPLNGVSQGECTLSCEWAVPRLQ
jgi:hypothetical protein